MLEMDVWYGTHQKFGHLGMPQKFINVLARVTRAETIVSATATVNDIITLDLTIGPDRRRLNSPGDLNAEINPQYLRDGVNTLTLRAQDVTGDVVEKQVYLEYCAQQTGTLPCAIEWNRASNLQEVAQVVDGKWAIENDTVRCVEPGYDRLIAIGDVAWRDYQVAVPITFHRFDPVGLRFPSVGQWAGLVLRWQGHADWSADQPWRGWYPLGAIIHYGFRKKTQRSELRMFGNNGFAIADDRNGTELALGKRYWFQARVESLANKPSRYTLKVWPDGMDESHACSMIGVGSPDELKHGSLVLAAHHTDASFGTIRVNPI